MITILALSWQHILIVAIIIGIVIFPYILYIITLQNTLQQIKPENKTISEGSLWLLLIPIFNLVWHFIVVNQISSSLRNESNSRNINLGELQPGQSIGITMCILNIIPYLNIIGFVLWIIYWYKISNYKNILISYKKN